MCDAPNELVRLWFLLVSKARHTRLGLRISGAFVHRGAVSRHSSAPIISATMIRLAASISARCENA